MIIRFGSGKTKFGPGFEIKLSGEEVAMAISEYLVAHNVHIKGACTISVNDELCKVGNVYVDPSGFVDIRQE